MTAALSLNPQRKLLTNKDGEKNYGVIRGLAFEVHFYRSNDLQTAKKTVNLIGMTPEPKRVDVRGSHARLTYGMRNFSFFTAAFRSVLYKQCAGECTTPD